MVRKTIIFFAALIVSVSCVDAFAVPSVRQLGTNVSATNAEKPVAALPSLPKNTASSEEVKTVKAQAKKESDDTARISLASAVKTISSARIKQPVTSAETQMAIAGVSETNFNAMADRVEALEGNALRGVTESGSGNYVTGVSVGSNNKLEVTKSRVLVAPVFQGNLDTGSSAEIWVVR